MAAMVRGRFPGVTGTRVGQVAWPQIAVHHGCIKASLPLGTMATIRRRLHGEHGLHVSVASLRRSVRAYLSEEVRRCQAVVLRDPAVPGEEAKIDFGQMGPGTDPVSGKKHRVQAFVMVLPASRHMFVRRVLLMDQHSWAGRRGGIRLLRRRPAPPWCPATCAHRGRTPGLYDPRINRSYDELAHHYGALVDPARSRKPVPPPTRTRDGCSPGLIRCGTPADAPPLPGPVLGDR